MGTINFHAAASRSQEVNAVLTKYFREGVKSLHTRAKILFLTHNQLSQQQQHVIRRGDRSKLVQRLVHLGPKIGPGAGSQSLGGDGQ